MQRTFDRPLNRYAPVLVDIFFDHVLSCEWPHYSPVPREEFIRTTYAALRPRLHLLPARAQYAANALLADDWLTCYATLDGIALSLSRLSHRLRHGIELAPSVEDFVVHRDAFTQAFNEFSFPQLRHHLEAGTTPAAAYTKAMTSAPSQNPPSAFPPALPPTPTSSRAKQLATFLDLIKFAHSIFALPFALIATFWAFRETLLSPTSTGAIGRLVLILACMVFARTWAMTFNRLIDRRFDAANPRTAKRPSVTGAVSVPFMNATLAICAILFLAGTSGFYFLYANPWPLLLALPVLGWLAAYSLTKRFTALCHFWLGISLGLAPVSAWLAIAPARRLAG